jgi:antitoxin ParD1/3/4
VTAIHKLRISLSEDQVAALHSAVESGEYATTSEIIREAVQDWQVKRRLQQQEAARLRDLWDRGKASGEPAPLDFDMVKTEARERLRIAAHKTDGD